jgi:hypothetical protein
MMAFETRSGLYFATITSEALMTAIVAGAKAEIVDGLIGNRRGNDHAVADIDSNVGGRRAFANLDKLALDPIARA